ncbi:MAG TPA: hypothetical protein VK082_08995 [Paenalcaligenes sp.]|nr:hypothetical protein [Paenalcaligenes sp.]
MSTGGPSQLGTILIQRLDSLLGITQSQQVNLASGARSDAVIPGEKSHPGRPLKHPDTRTTAQTKHNNQPAQITPHHKSSATTNSPLQHDGTQKSLQTHLGRTAQFILQLLNQQPKASAITGRRPLLQPLQTTSQAQQTHELRAPKMQQRLRNELFNSGLFYESLLYDSMHRQSERDDRLQQQPQNTLTANTYSANEPSPEPPPELRTIIRQQLELLATQQWEWRGELWPGMQMLWRNQAQPDADDYRDTNKSHCAPWNSQIELLFSLDDTLGFNIQWTAQELTILISATPTRIKQLKSFVSPLKERLRSIHPKPHIHWQEQVEETFKS